MDGISVVLGIVVAAVAIYLVVKPLLVPEPQEEDSRIWEEGKEEKEGLLAALAEVELDYQMGKITAEDYAAWQESYQAKALQALDGNGKKGAKAKARLDTQMQEELERELEKELAEIRKKVRKSQ